MYRTPLLAATSSSRRALINLGLSASSLYDPVFRALAALAQRYAAAGQSLRPQDVSAKDLVDLEILPTYVIDAGEEGLAFPPTVLERRPAPTFLGNAAATNPGEMALLHPLAGFSVWLNSTATLIWHCCDGCRTVRQIVDHLQSTFPDVTRDTLEHDLVATLATLSVLDLLTWEEPA